MKPIALTKQDYGTLLFSMEEYVGRLVEQQSLVPTRFYEIIAMLSDTQRTEEE